MRNAFPTEAIERQCYGVDAVSSPFQRRNYGHFAFLAGVRNYSCCEPLDLPRGLPRDCDLSGGCAVIDELEVVEELHIQGAETLRNAFHSHSWFLLSELLGFDYEKVFWNRRVKKGINSAALAEEGEGIHLSYRDFLGPLYFKALDVMKGLGPPAGVRVVFCFGD